MGVTVQTKRLKVSDFKIYDGVKITTLNIKRSWRMDTRGVFEQQYDALLRFKKSEPKKANPNEFELA